MKINYKHMIKKSLTNALMTLYLFSCFLFLYEYLSREFLNPDMPYPELESWVSELIMGGMVAVWLRSFFKKNMITLITAALIPIMILFSFDMYYQVFYEPLKVYKITPSVLIQSWSDLPVFVNASIVVFMGIIAYSIHYKAKALLTLLLFPLGFILATYSYSFTFDHSLNTKGQVDYWNDFSFNSNGRLLTMTYEQSHYYHKKRMLENASVGVWEDNFSSSRQSLLAGRKLDETQLPNIYVYLLESYIDLNNLNIKDDEKIYNYDFKKNIQPNMGSAIPPVIGGGSVNSEFELLCGVPSKRMLGFWDFSLIKSMQQPKCMMMNLKDLGYEARLHHGGNPFEYDSGEVYEKIGFNKTSYTTTSYFTSDYTNPNLNYHITDLELSDQMLSLNKKEQTKRPIFNYILGKYGHYPFDIDKQKFPPMDAKNQHSWPLINKLVHQEFYRQQFISRIIANIESSDKNSLIVITGDHTPPVTEKRNKVFLNEKSTPLLVRYKNKWHKYENIHTYQIHEIVFNLITNNKFCKEHHCTSDKDEDNSEELYLSFFSNLDKQDK